MPRPPANKVVLYVRLSASLRATLKALRKPIGARYLSEVIEAAIVRALDELETAHGALLVPVSGEESEATNFKVSPELETRLKAAAEAFGIDRQQIVRAGLVLLGREREVINPGEVVGGDRA